MLKNIFTKIGRVKVQKWGKHILKRGGGHGRVFIENAIIHSKYGLMSYEYRLPNETRLRQCLISDGTISIS